MSQDQKAVQAQAIALKDGQWTEEAEQALKARYSGNADNENLGKMVQGKTAAAVRSKLVSLGVYEKNEPKAVGGASSTRKLEYVRAVETMLSMKKGSLDSLEKGRKDELEALAEALTKTADTAK
jgi:hypothetical protein